MRTKEEEKARLKALYQDHDNFTLETLKEEQQAHHQLMRKNAYTSKEQAIITNAAYQELIKELEETKQAKEMTPEQLEIELEDIQTEITGNTYLVISEYKTMKKSEINKRITTARKALQDLKKLINKIK